jgi:hypothetical protein
VSREVLFIVNDPAGSPSWASTRRNCSGAQTNCKTAQQRGAHHLVRGFIVWVGDRVMRAG